MLNKVGVLLFVEKDKAPGARQAPGADGGKQERKVWAEAMGEF
jgi:hypothetical protein